MSLLCVEMEKKIGSFPFLDKMSSSRLSPVKPKYMSEKCVRNETSSSHVTADFSSICVTRFSFNSYMPIGSVCFKCMS